ncbi:MAG: hypothetical protein ACTHJW_29235, partial [Streptosporangiaceae bacterium]
GGGAWGGVLGACAFFWCPHPRVMWPALSYWGGGFFPAHVADGGSSALIATCASLRASIDDAISDGRVEVLPP